MKWTLFLAFLLAMLPARAMAYDCNALVVDDAGVLGSGIASVEAAAQKLESAGAYVRVRTVNDFGGFADVDRYEADYEGHCQAWQDMNGGTKSNLLVFAVSFGDQRGAGLYYGDLWKRALDQQWNSVLVDEVVPRLRDGDAPAALKAGLDGINEIVVAAKAARIASSSGTAPVVVVQQASAPSQPTDLTGLWWVFGLIVIVVVGVMIVRSVLAAMRRAEERREAQQRAKLALQACVNYVVTAEQPLVLAEAKVNGQKGVFAEDDLEPMRAALAEARRQLMAAQTEYGELQNADANPDKSGLTAGEYRNLEARYDGLRERFIRACEPVSRIDARITELTALAASASADFDAASGNIESAGARITAVEQVGFRVEGANATLGRAVEALERAESAIKGKSFGQMKTELAEVRRLAAEAAEAAEDVQGGKTQIDAGIATQRADAGRVNAIIERAGAVFQEISVAYALESWTNINGNGSQAEQMIDDAEGALDAAVAAASMETQDWIAARNQIVSAVSNIEHAEALANAIISLKHDLDAAKAAAPGEIEAAAADIRTARDFIAQHDADVDDGLETRLDEAENALGNAHQELAKDLPNYLAVVKAARAVNATADGILAKAQGEHDAAERLRQRAATALREAERSVDAASRFIQGHCSEVDSDAERLAESAEDTLESAQRATTLADQIRYADQADQEADRALDMAKRDVRAREEEREREARRQREAAQAIIRAAHRASSSSGGFGGGRSGGSVGFGGRGGRSGGSVSSGGRGGRGGGSVGW